MTTELLLGLIVIIVVGLIYYVQFVKNYINGVN